MSIVFASFKHPKLPISIKIPVTLLPISIKIPVTLHQIIYLQI